MRYVTLFVLGETTAGFVRPRISTTKGPLWLTVRPKLEQGVEMTDEDAAKLALVTVIVGSEITGQLKKRAQAL